MGNRVRNNTKISERRDQRKKSKKSRSILIASVSAAVCIAVAVIAIISSLPVRFEAEGDYIIDRSTGIKYLVASSSYAPRTYVDPAYGKFEEHYIYPVSDDIKTSEYLSRSYFGVFDLLYREDLTLPTLSEFGANKIRICSDGAVITRVDDITNEDEISELIDIILNAETVEEPASIDTVVYTLRMYSSKYDWLYYNVNYVVYDEGCYLYDRLTDRFVEAGDIIDRYINGSDTEETETEAAETEGTESTDTEKSDTN